MVDELRKKNLFVTAVDDDATVVRYHALFRDFLLKKLAAQANPGEIKKLYTIAARYFKETDDPVRSVNLYLASGQFEQAVRQIEACGQVLIARGQTQTLLRWLDALPLDVGDRPWFLFYKAVACRFTDPRRALTFFDRAHARFRSERGAGNSVPGQMLSLCGIIEACFYTGGNFKRMERAAATANTLLKQGSRGSADARARLLLAIGTAYFFVGRLSQGVEALKQALELFRKIGNHFYQVHSAIYLAPCSIYFGDFRLAREAVRKGFEAHKSIPDEAGGEAALYMAQAMTALFEGSFAEAQECIDKCHGLAHEYDLEAFDFLSLDIGGWLKTATGDYENAEQLLLECKRKGEDLENAFFNTSSAHLLAVNYLHQNKLNDALREADYALAVRAQMGSKLFSAVSLSALGAIHLKLGKLAQAGRELAGALKVFQQIGAAQQQANVLLLLAKMSLKRKNARDTNQYLKAGFRIGQERGFTYYYLLNATNIRELARTALAAGICTEYCELLLKKYAHENGSSRIKITCLGGFSVQRGSTLIKDSEWKSKRSKALIKLLVAQDGQKVPRDIIIETLWPGPSSESNRQTLNSMLHRVRKLLEQDAGPEKSDSCILQEGNLIGLNNDTVWTDVGEFLSRIETAVRMKHGNERKKSVEEYEKAFTLYRGDFLAEDLYEDWAGEARDRLRLVCFKALEDAAEISDSLGDKSKAALLYEKLFHADPCSEKACCWLMSWHLAAGQRSEAIRTYERCQRALSKELDVEPDARTKTLYRSIIGG
jgi:DNA-binding SARP family transcriptional activator